MNMTLIASEYLNSASVLKGRMDELKVIQKSKSFKDQKKIGDRIVVLNAEYYHLIHIAGYLECYYEKAPSVSILEAKYN